MLAAKKVVVLSAHPDDSSIGPPATIARLQAEGWDVTDFCCSLGGTNPEDQQRRLREVTEASRRAGIRLRLADPLAALNSMSHPERYEQSLTLQIKNLVRQLRPAIIVAPHPHELHPGHEVVARATLKALSTTARPPVLWCWNIWGDLPYPSLYTPFDQTILDKIKYALDAYTGELDRIPYWDMVRGRAILNQALGSEKVFHFGATLASPEPYAEVLLEVVLSDGKWLRGTPRVFDPQNPFAPPTKQDISWWLTTPSPRALLEDNA